MATNAAYREKFGIPFVVCVREHASPDVDPRRTRTRRLGNTREQEIETALGEIAKIARLRLGGRAVSLSTHVLDTVTGPPRGGRRARAAARSARSSRRPVTDDRRAPRRSATSRPASTSSMFAVGDYFGSREFLDRVPVRFRIADAGAKLPRAAARFALGLQHLPGS